MNKFELILIIYLFIISLIIFMMLSIGIIPPCHAEQTKKFDKSGKYIGYTIQQGNKIKEFDNMEIIFITI